MRLGLEVEVGDRRRAARLVHVREPPEVAHVVNAVLRVEGEVVAPALLPEREIEIGVAVEEVLLHLELAFEHAAAGLEAERAFVEEAHQHVDPRALRDFEPGGCKRGCGCC